MTTRVSFNPPSEPATFKSRHGRLRTRRREALRSLLPRYGVSVTGEPLDPAAWFGRRDAPLVVEIGTGMGEHVLRLAAANPGREHLAVEVHAPGVANLLLTIEERGLDNLRVAHGDALTLLRQRIPAGSLAAIYAMFPDPWPKQRHHKRRLFQASHVALLRSRLAPGGSLHAATDSPEYAQVIMRTLTDDPELSNAHERWAPRPDQPRSRYEHRAWTAGRDTFEVWFHRVGNGAAVSGCRGGRPGVERPPGRAGR